VGGQESESLGEYGAGGTWDAEYLKKKETQELCS